MNAEYAHLLVEYWVLGQVAHSACGRYPGLLGPGPVGKHAEMHVSPELLVEYRSYSCL